MPNPSFERDSPEAGCPSIQTLAMMKYHVTASHVKRQNRKAVE